MVMFTAYIKTESIIIINPDVHINRWYHILEYLVMKTATITMNDKIIKIKNKLNIIYFVYPKEPNNWNIIWR